MKRGTKVLMAVVAALVVLAVAIPAVAAPTWKTKASVNSKGAGPATTEAMANTIVEKPHAVRIGFRTPKGVSRTVDYGWWLGCERREAERWDRSVTTPADGSWRWVTIQRPSDGLGRYCDVLAYGALEDRARLHLRIEAQHR